MDSFSFTSNGRLIQFDQTAIMGVVNVTPDSFYAKSRVQSEGELISRVKAMLEEGADIIDVGAMSSRPGAAISDPFKEEETIVWAVKCILKRFPEAIISIDTIHSRVAQSALSVGAYMINDISAGNYDADMIRTMASFKCPYVCMHMRGTPVNMMELADYENVVSSVMRFFKQKVEELQRAGVHQLILDPGFGFAKTVAQNYTLLNQMEILHVLDTPILVGVSRKSMIYKLLDASPEESLNGTTVLHTILLQKGVQLLRVHDVKEAVEVRKIVQYMRSSNDL